MNQHSTTFAPKWVVCDSTMDAEEFWQEVTDPQNQWGELCTAFFDHGEILDHKGTGLIAPCLSGVCVTGSGDDDVIYIPRWNLEHIILGKDVVARIEAAQFEAQNGVAA